MSDHDKPLLCALCGKPVPVLECVIQQSGNQRMNWHWDCADQDEWVMTKIPFSQKVQWVSSRGIDRVGRIEDADI